MVLLVSFIDFCLTKDQPEAMETDEFEQEVDIRDLEDETSAPDDKQTDGNEDEQQKTEADQENTEGNDGTDKLEDGEQPKVNGCSSPSFLLYSRNKKMAALGLHNLTQALEGVWRKSKVNAKPSVK